MTATSSSSAVVIEEMTEKQYIFYCRKTGECCLLRHTNKNGVVFKANFVDSNINNVERHIKECESCKMSKPEILKVDAGDYVYYISAHSKHFEMLTSGPVIVPLILQKHEF